MKNLSADRLFIIVDQTLIDSQGTYFHCTLCIIKSNMHEQINNTCIKVDSKTQNN